MKKRSLAAMAVTMLIAAASATTFVAPQMAYAQVSDAKVPAQSTIA
ncbi:MAG: MotA/TolQ/ExbB proton channel family protein, partial [Chloroflexi bacterium]|nr:MotA/TolQ/ExbB proton channel family protein [Chloroflexota bacterium]